MGKDIGIDLGTASVIVYVKDKGIVLREPSVIAVDKTTKQIVKIGREAQMMLGRTSGNIVAIRPLKDGVISQYDYTSQMITYFIKRACGNTFFRPRVIVCVPSGITEVEERAVVDAARGAGAKRTYIIEEPVAAAIGAGIDISQSTGRMIVDIGGGTTDIAVISLGGVVVSQSIKVAGDKFDEAIIRYIKRRYNVLIGERTAEEIKVRIGSVWPHEEPLAIDVKGRCLIQGLPKVVRIQSAEIIEALEEPITLIIEAICSVIERTPPELVGDILNHGIVMTGGGSMLRGFDKLIANITGIKTRVADKPIFCVAEGTGISLDRISSIPDGQFYVTPSRRFHR